jgi:hypothetical protein
VAQPVPILIEDGTELTHNAWRLLEAEGRDLGLPDLHVVPISDFFQAAEQNRTSIEDRKAILDQATLMFDHLYPHMPFKTELYHFTHPSDYLNQNVLPNIDTLGETEFHAQMTSAFSLVRDAHTLYGLPSPFRRAVAFLPFQMRPHLVNKAGWRFVVTTIMNSQPDAGFGHAYFGPGAEVVGWGELATLDHLSRTEQHLPGGNYFASFARSAIHSTLRPLVFVQLPFADETPAATIYYRAPGGDEQIRAIRLPWGVGTGFDPDVGFPSSAFSISPATAVISTCGKYLHHRTEMYAGKKESGTVDPGDVSTIPEIFDYQYTGGSRTKGFIDLTDLCDPSRPEARFGYIKIQGFTEGSSAPGFTDRIVQEFERIVTLMDRVAPDGLILDIRNNPGGDVQAAERMLQMLTAREIQPVQFHLANTQAVLDILRGLKASMKDRNANPDELAELQAWLDDAESEPMPKGSRLTSGRPLTDPDSANDTGQIYQGRGVTLLINSLTYSAADIFAAGFQDHGIGVILGTSLITGAGGANLWSHDDLLTKVGPSRGIPLAKLPGDASMSIAIRRCSRIGREGADSDDPAAVENAPIEDLGVKVDILYESETVEDVIGGHPGILRRACEALRDKVAHRVDVRKFEVLDGGQVSVDVETVNIASLKLILDGRLSVRITGGGGLRTVLIPAITGVANPVRLRIEGYTPDELIRARTIVLQKPVTLNFGVAGSITDSGPGGGIALDS